MSQTKGQQLDIERVIRLRAGRKADKIPKFVFNWIKKFIHQDFINGYLGKGYIGVEFCANCCEYLGVTLEVEGLENLPKDGRRCTFASNHPLGAIDGVTLGGIIGKEYDGNIKYLMNDLLMSLDGMAPLGVPINKIGDQARNLPKLIKEIFESDNQVIIFPAGLCSRKIDGKIQDLPWTKTFITQSIRTQRDIVPVHYSGENSKRFYRIATWQKRLGIKFNIAMMFLPDEMYRSQGKTYKVTIGKPIPYTSLDKSKTPHEWAQEIRKRVYEL